MPAENNLVYLQIIGIFMVEVESTTLMLLVLAIVFVSWLTRKIKKARGPQPEKLPIPDTAISSLEPLPRIVCARTHRRWRRRDAVSLPAGWLSTSVPPPNSKSATLDTPQSARYLECCFMNHRSVHSTNKAAQKTPTIRGLDAAASTLRG